jgi:hypothetical protein
VNRIALVVAALGLAACATRPTYQPPAGNTAYGTYPFKEVLPNANPPMVLEGTVLLLPDTVMMTLAGKSCSPDPNARNGAMFAYNCGEFGFYLSRENPLRQNTYRVPTMVWKTEQICDAYTTNPTTMAAVCTRYRQQRVETRVVLSGSLKFLAR